MTQSIELQKFNTALLNEEAAWWQMELPSGIVFFGDSKTKMLGYPEENFKTYQDFTNLLHPDDYENSMEAMRAHLEGRAEAYECKYRIKCSDGKYITFYDYGQINKKDKSGISVIGFVLKIKENSSAEKQISEFKQLVNGGETTLIELFTQFSEKN